MMFEKILVFEENGYTYRQTEQNIITEIQDLISKSEDEHQNLAVEYEYDIMNTNMEGWKICNDFIYEIVNDVKTQKPAPRLSKENIDNSIKMAKFLQKFSNNYRRRGDIKFSQPGSMTIKVQNFVNKSIDLFLI